jgi:hypothetical protein
LGFAQINALWLFHHDGPANATYPSPCVLYLCFESKPACKQICTFVAASFTVHIPHLVARGLNCSAAGIAGPLSVMSLFGCSQDIGTLAGLETRFVSG